MQMRIRMVNPENDVTDQGVFMNVGGNSSSVMHDAKQQGFDRKCRKIYQVGSPASLSVDALCPEHKLKNKL